MGPHRRRRLQKWMDDVERILNEGTRAYPTLDYHLNAATIELSELIKRTKEEGPQAQSNASSKRDELVDG